MQALTANLHIAGFSELRRGEQGNSSSGNLLGATSPGRACEVTCLNASLLARPSPPRPYARRMDWEIIWVGASGIAAIVSVIAGGVSWARSNISKQAKADAEAARDAAQRHLRAAESTAAATAEQAEHLRGIGDVMKQSTTPPRLTLTHLKGSLYRLHNNTANYVTVEQIENQGDFFRIDLKPMTEVEAFHAVDFIIAGANGIPVPAQLVLGLVGEDDSTVVPIPPK